MKKIFAVTFLILIFSSGAFAMIFIRQGDFDAKFEILSNKIDNLGNEIHAKLEAINERLDGLEKRMDGLETRMNNFEKRMDGLEHRVERIEDRNEGRVNLMLTALAAGVAWLTLVATVLAFFKKPENETAKSSLTLEDVQNIAQTITKKLIEENNAKMRLNEGGIN